MARSDALTVKNDWINNFKIKPDTQSGFTWFHVSVFFVRRLLNIEA